MPLARTDWPLALVLILAGPVLMLAGPPGYAIASEPAGAPDTLYINGHVYTVDANDSVQEAVAVKNGRISYVGSSSGAKVLATPATQVVDLLTRLDFRHRQHLVHNALRSGERRRKRIRIAVSLGAK